MLVAVGATPRVAYFHPRYGKRVRVEHWGCAKWQGEHVAGNLLEENEPYLKSPYFFDELVVRGDLAARDFTAFWMRDGQVTAAMNVNQWDDGDALKALVEGHAAVTARNLP
ncbi:hypothetical protein BS329_03185 [Amycolatopsis coloradensis]|uniref:Reductase C-terminal domain-containing protein n=1 Tax=Amycolatopsis coloradensis TaxID=76021 RepID=A0A1R0L2Q4_9PSEU|nr:hypothetical protein BS329_03185 [Amycolatopsis coloradensis]